MTTVRDLDMPVINGERRHPGTDRGNVRIVAFLAISTAVLTLMNLAASVYLYKTTGQVRLVQKQLDQLANFEKRLIGRLDLVNIGVQGQFDKLNSDLPGRFSEIQHALGRLTTSLDALDLGSGYRGAEGLAVDFPQEIVGPGAGSEAIAERDVATTSPLPRRSAQKPVPAISPAYTRVETSDGKILYRKIR